MSVKKVLLLHISNVSGHKKATEAINSALKQIDPTVQTLSINAFNYTNPISEKIVNSLYMSILKRIPSFWDYLYDNPSVVKALNRYKKIVHSMNLKKLKKLYDQFEADAVVCTQAFPCGMMADFKKKYNLDFKIFAVLTDYIAHSFWIYDNVDYYICPDQVVKRTLIQKGIKEDRIKPFGIPIDPKFNSSFDKNSIKKSLGLEIDKPTILVMGGGQGIGPIKAIISLLIKTSANFQIIVVAGSNKKLYKWLCKIKNRLQKKIFPFGFINNIEELMCASDLVITKPGGITTAEALTMKLPMLIVNPLPGQEEYNSHHLLSIKAAIKVGHIKRIPGIIDMLFKNQEALNNLSVSAKDASHPASAIDMAKLIIESF